MLIKLRKWKKGFSLFEMVAVITILSIFTVVLTPALIGSVNESKEKSDVSYSEQVVNVIKSITQEAKAYYTFSRIAQETTDKRVVFIFETHDGYFDFVAMDNPSYATKTMISDEEKAELEAILKNTVQTQLAGTIENHTMQSLKYKDNTFHVAVQLTAREYFNDVTGWWGDSETA